MTDSENDGDEPWCQLWTTSPGHITSADRIVSDYMKFLSLDVTIFKCF